MRIGTQGDRSRTFKNGGSTDAGITFGLPDDPSVPRAFGPWQNIAYIAEGDAVIEEMSQQQEAAPESEEAETAAP